ncbi:MAG: AAA family ATPase [Clostridium sp.]|jgi:predicted ATP-dependent endonuclease of OLD family|nr:AAA family ATPase [Clostridium sp.]
MSDIVKICKLEIENVKRVKAVKMEPSANGLTIIGGNNNQGKTSVLDAIVWALGGDKYRPSNATREGSVIPPNIHITLSNGLVIERKGKNSDLKVTDPSGQKSGQQLLNEFVGQLALDLPKFMEASGTEKAKTLLQIIGVGDQLTALDLQEKTLYNERVAIGRIADQKEKYSKEQVFYPEVPKDIVSASDLIKAQQEILARNGLNQKKRDEKDLYAYKVRQASDEIDSIEKKILDLQNDLAVKKLALQEAQYSLSIATTAAQDLIDESTKELEESISNVEETNRKVRANLDKDKAEEDARDYRKQYEGLTTEIEQVRKQKTDLLANATLPLQGLAVMDGELTYHNQKWDCMSGSDRLKVSTAIVRKLYPKCGFVLMDKLEQMDLTTLKEFGAWLESEGLQVIATKVSTGEECSIIISDGYVDGQAPAVVEQKTWKAGEF